MKFLSGLGDIRNVSTIQGPINIEDPIGGTSNDGISVSNDISGQSFSNENLFIYSLESKTSDNAGFSTLFNNFQFQVKPIYNFYSDDEEVNEYGYDLKNKKLEEIPRYILLSWNKAPATKNPPLKHIKLPTDKRTRYNNTVSSNKKIDNFSVYKDATINGFISPGSMNAVVENVNSDEEDQVPQLDEEVYLKSKDTVGIPYSDIQANINSHFNPNVTTQDVLNSSVLKSLNQDKNDIVDGKFSILKKDGVKINSTDSTSPNISLNISTAKSIRDSKTTLINNFVDSLSLKDNSQKIKRNFTEINFIDPAITGLVQSSRVNLMTKPEHAENIAGIAQNLTNLKGLSDLKYDLTIKQEPPSFTGKKEDSGTEYVGYVIEKYVQNNNGIFVFVDEISIDDVNTIKFIDTKVLYGKVYRYRIKCIFKWTREDNINISMIHKNNVSNLIFNKNRSIKKYKTSFFSSEWCRNWEYASVMDTTPPPHPDEFTVFPQSHKKRIVITFKVPQNNQKDIQYFRLFKKLKDKNNNDLSDWELIDIKIGANNFVCIDEDVDYFENNELYYVYCAQTVTKHAEFSVLSEQLMTRLNKNYSVFGEYDVKQLSESGTTFKSLGKFATLPLKKSLYQNIFKKSIMFTSRLGTSKFPNLQRDYVIRLKSLDTGHIIYVPISMTYKQNDTIFNEIVEQSSIKPKLSKSEPLINLVKNNNINILNNKVIS